MGSTGIIPPKHGVWCPAVTFIDPDTDELDLESQTTYYSYLSKTGLAGLVILGTNAEAFLLTREERSTLIAAARAAVGETYPIMAGCGSHSTKQTLELIHDAHRAGANYALVLPAAYFGKATTPKVIENFFLEVADKSPLPIVLYNFPGVCNGVDLDSDMITRLAKKNENIVGVKLTCASVGKITRLAASDLSKDEFSTFGGQSDFLIGGLAAGSAGCIAAFANVFPTLISRIYNLYQAGKKEEATALHLEAALAESHIKSGIAATKYATSVLSASFAGIKDAERRLQPRRPYEPLTDAAKNSIREGIIGLGQIEKSLVMERNA
ncbi:putative dihydrodipicolinate synthetase [Phaeomoniella chlamydospora]|uniref:Putative dihydrodipicolinate synthetase n=1 Tax=Phaeomoniella chlamydospora TaxID=158046 RepID=A0A0G2E0M9_PHACM|nr:putative dihydrodipicolinate synthetase [Phaeomoniella chlamydospora]